MSFSLPIVLQRAVFTIAVLLISNSSLAAAMCIDGFSIRPKPGKVQLKWTHVPNAEYAILRSAQLSGPYEVIGHTDSTFSTYLDDTVALQQRYYYQIKRIIPATADCVSNVIAVYTPSSRRERIYDVPNIIGLNEAEAELALRRGRFLIGDVVSVADAAPVGTIIMADPPAKSVVLVRSVVNIVVSAGAGGPPANQAPDCQQAVANPNNLWPPNHKFQSITIDGVTDPDNDSLTISVQCILQDEPLNVDGDGNTEYDGSGIGNATAKVRRERQGGGNGRVYHIDFTATDPQGASCQGSVTTAVPAANNGQAAVDDGRLYVSVENESHCNITPPDNNAPQITSTAPLTAVATQAYSYPVQANDADNDPLTFALSTAPAGASIASRSGVINWLPAVQQVGNQAFTVTVSDGNGGSDSQSFTVVVAPAPNTAPSANAAAVATDEDTALAINLTGSDPEGDSLTFNLLTQPANGVLSGTAPNVSYTPNANYNGNDSFTFNVNDGQLDSNTATVSIAVNAINDAPTADAQTLSVDEDTSFSITLSGSDTEGDTLSFALVSQPTNGALSGTAPDISYTPNANFHGNDSFTFIVNDGQSDSLAATVAIMVNPINDPPTAVAQQITLNEDGTTSITLSGNDIDGDALSFVITVPPTNGILQGTAPQINYQPNPDVTGSDSFTFTVSDGVTSSAAETVTITINPVNDAPVANAQSLITNEDTALAINLHASDADGDSLSYQVGSPSNGVLSGTPPTLSYTPNANFNGNDSFTFSVNDGALDSNTASIAITVTAQNDAPDFASQPPQTTLIVGDVFTYAVQLNDVDGDSPSLTLSAAPAGMQLDSGSNTLSWDTAAANTLPGDYAVSLTASDSHGGVNSQNFVITVLPDGRAISHEGREFWLTPLTNFLLENSSPRPDFFIYLVSREADANAVINIPALSINDSVALPAGQIITYTVPADRMNALNIATINAIRVNAGIHITADNNITVYALNTKTSTTDGFLALPVRALGQEYIVSSYTAVGNQDEGSVFAVLATQDNTQVTITPTMEVVNDNQFPVAPALAHPAQQAYTITLNTGDVYQVESDHTLVQDFTGTRINSNQPVVVYGSNACGQLPVAYKDRGPRPYGIDVGPQDSPLPFGFCDHLVEQLMPQASLAADYMTLPLAGRTGGDSFRVVAPFDNTDIYLNDVFVATIDAGEFYDYITDQASVLRSSEPVQLTQFSNGDQYDNGFGNTIYGDIPERPNVTARFADPFMVLIPPREQYLKQYQINTPATGFSVNSVNVIVPNSALASVALNGVNIPADQFQAIAGTAFSGAQLPIAAGSHSLQADAPFGLMVYGYDNNDSYGYLGGVALSEYDTVDHIDLSLQSAPATVGEQACVTAAIRDANNNGLAGARVRFTVSGSRELQRYVLADLRGDAQYCYQGILQTQDTVTAQVLSISRALTIDWQPDASGVNHAPVITSKPILYWNDGDTFRYRVIAVDPEGDSLSYSLLQAPVGMTMDAAGQITWPNSAVLLERPVVEVLVTDGNGGEVRQAFQLSTNLPFNDTPQFAVSPNLTATVAVPYIYNAALSDNELALDDVSVIFNDDGDRHYVSIAQGPAAASIEQIDNASVQNLLRWTPAAAGAVDFQLNVVDSRDGRNQQRFTVNVLDNLPPSIDSTPPLLAAANNEYIYIVAVSNDVPIDLSNADAVNLQLIEGPAGMVAERLRNADNNGWQFNVRWTPTAADIGQSVNVRFAATDRVHSTEQAYRLTVSDTQPPVINSTPANSVEARFEYQYQIDATDPEGNALRYRFDFAPSGMTVDSNGLVRWQTSDADEGFYNIILAVDDGQGGVTRQTFQVSVTPYINRAPQLLPQIIPPQAKVGREWRYTVLIDDMENDPLTHSLVAAPANAIIDSSTGEIRWTPTADQIGTANFTQRVVDGFNISEFDWQVDVLPASAPLETSLHVAPSLLVNEGEQWTVTVITDNTAGPITVDLQFDAQPVAVNIFNQAQVTAPAIGVHEFTVSVSDGFETASNSLNVFVRDPNDTDFPVVNLLSPANGSEVTAPSPVTGTVTDANLFSWAIKLRSARDAQGENDITLASGFAADVGADDQVSGTLDPSLLMNGKYLVILEGTDLNGQTATVAHGVNIEGNLKVGNFSFTLEDMNIPLSGIPVSIKRTYDTRRKQESLDFGHGWSVDYQSVLIEENVEPTQGWQQVRANVRFDAGGGGGVFVSNAFCTVPIGAKEVSVTLPDGSVEAFNVSARAIDGGAQSIDEPSCYLTLGRNQTLAFVAKEGTHSTLTLTDQTVFYLTDLDDGHLAADFLETEPAPVSLYTLTTREGFVYHLDQNFGILSFEDPNGNTITYSDAGILHSDGKSITFERDSDNRITALVDPMGHRVEYAYDGRGDLISSTDQVGAVMRYVYNNEHAMLELIDPSGRRLVRNIYNDAGRLIAQEDNDGNRTEFNHDLQGRISIVTDRLGRATQHAYDARGNILTIVDALGNATEFTYDSEDNQLSQTNARGHSSTATYNSEDDQLTQTDELGNTITFAYNDKGQETRIVDARLNEFINSYNEAGELLSVQDPRGNTAQQVVNNKGQVTRRTDAVNGTTTFVYDSEGNITQETAPDGAVTTREYDANNNLITETVTRTDGTSTFNEITRFRYDNRNRVVQVINANGQSSFTEYDLNGHERARVDELGRRTEMDYDPYGRLIETRYPDGTQEHNSYDAEGNLLSQTDRNGRVTQFAYDALNRLTSTTFADGSTTHTAYDAVGNVIAEIDENGNRTEHEYDAANRRILTRNALNQVFRFEYDQDGNLIREIDALNRTTTHVYDSLDNRIETRFANGQRIQTEYDALGRVIAEIDEAGLRTEFVYDSKGNLTQVKQGTDVDGDTLATEDGATTTFTYDEQNNKTSQTDALGRTTRWRYDRLGRVIVRTLPNNLSESYSYDRVGNRTGRTPFDFALRENNTFDVNNRLIEADYTGANAVTETFQYDNVGNRISAANAEGTHTWEYDNRDRLIRETKPNGDEIEYAYDSAGNRTTVTTTVNTNGGGTTSRTETYEYDVLNRLARVIDEHNNITTYTYDAVGNRETMTFPNGNVTTYTYDQRNRLTAMSTANPSATLLERYNYTLHPTGRRTHIDELDGRRSQYQYDDLYRMTSETITDSQNGNHQADYQYDAVGNRTQSIINGVTTAYTYDVNDQLVSQGGETYTYDFNGSLRTHRIGFSTTTYTYNAKQQLIQVSKPGEQINYAYDVDGNRISSTENSNTTDYLVDTNRDFAQVLNEKVNNAIEVHYVHGDDLISQDSASNIRYYHTDGLGSTRHLSDAGGSLTDSYDYAAFGELLNSTGASENRYLFTGEQFDSFTSNYYLRARYYSPHSARFTQMDPFQGVNRIPVSLNKYLYANSDPANFTDPSGNFSIGEALAIANTIGTLFSFAQTVNAGLEVSENGGNFSARDLGFSLIVGRLSGASKILKALASKICKKVNCKVPVLDVNHIFYGEIKNRTAKGFHSTALTTIVAGAGVANVEQVLWKNANGVYKAWVNVPDTKTRRFRRKQSTMFPDSWSSHLVGASLYLAWIKNRGKQQGTLNLGFMKIQYFVRDKIWLQGFPLR